VRQALPQKMLLYDKTGEEHYSTISALHKSIRGSDPQAAVYWLARMLEAGEDPLYLARRLVRIAVEDVGLADPQALAIAVAAKDAYHFLGTPEGELALAEVAIYLACAPKSNRADQAYQAARAAVQRHGALPVPLPLRNAVTPAMKALGYGKGYLYAHDFENAYAAQDYLPEALRGEEYYRPGKFGFEKEIRKRLEWWRKLREEGGQSREADAGENDSERRSRS
jgi:putative ATPase